MGPNSGDRLRGPLIALARHYTRGLLAVILVAFVARLASAIWPTETARLVWAWLSGGADRWVLAIAGVLLLLPLIGLMSRVVVHPILGRWSGWRGFVAFQDSLATELAPDASRGYTIVLVDWPSEEIGTLAVLTSAIASPDADGQRVAVFIPGAPNPTRGFIRMVSPAAIHATDWTLRDFWSFQLSYGTAVPLPASVDGLFAGPTPAGDGSQSPRVRGPFRGNE